MKFDLDPKKKAQKVKFERSVNKIDHPSLFWSKPIQVS